MNIFAYPSYLWLILYAAALACILLLWIPHKRRKFTALLLRTESLRTRLTEDQRQDLRTVKSWTVAAACTVLVVALAGPQWGIKTVPMAKLSGNLVIALDISDSMLAEDVKPNRLERAKFELIDAFVKNESGRPWRLGLVTFAGRAYLQCPLTLDTYALKFMLESVGAGTLPYPGTNIGAALKVSAAVLEKAGGAKHILIVTDGEDNKGEIPSALVELAKSGIRVSALWLGSPSGEPIPLKDENGKFLGYKKDRKGNTVLTRAQPDKLAAVVEKTGGRFIRLDEAGVRASQSLRSLLDTGNEGKGKETNIVLENRFQWPLGLGFLLLLAEMVMPEKRKK